MAVDATGSSPLGQARSPQTTAKQARSDATREALVALLMEQAATQEPRSADDFLPLITDAAALQAEANTLLRSVVTSARNAGATWASIGATLRMTKQAAQKRFASTGGPGAEQLDPDERILGPTNFIDEMRELALAGPYGWHSVERGLTYHRVVRSDTQWEHRAIWSPAKVRLLRADGWTLFGSSFPYSYLKRDTGVPALPEPPA